MTNADRSQEPGEARRWLGLPESASPAELLAAYWRLRSHLEARIRAHPHAAGPGDPRQQLEQLHQAFLALPEIGSADKSPPSPALSLRPQSGLALWVFVALSAVLGFSLLWMSWGGSETPGVGSPSDRPAQAELILEADPPSAKLWVQAGEDNRVILTAQADGSSQTLEPGDYSLSVAHPDCPDDWSQAITLKAGETRHYAPSICQGEGHLIVRSNIKDDRLTLDGIDLGVTSEKSHPLRTGTHRVRVEKAGYRPWEAEVVVRPDEEIQLYAEMTENNGQENTSPGSQAASQAAPPAFPMSGPGSRNGGASRAAGMIGKTAQKIPLRTGQGGSKTWHDAVVEDLVRQYDQNGSGTLDTKTEINAIPCTTWIEIEQSYETGGLAVEMTHLYGFDGSPAPANTLGITPSVRADAYERMKSCGLRARR